MAQVFRLAVLKAITDQIKTITPANLYAHDMSDFTDSVGRTQQRVFRGRDNFGTNDPIPMVSILEDPRAMEANNGSGGSPAAMNSFKLLIQGFVRDDADNPLDPAYNLSAEVIKALVQGKSNKYDILGFGHKAPCVTGLSIGQPVHRPGGDEVSDVAYFLVGVTLTLAEILDQPFIEGP